MTVLQRRRSKNDKLGRLVGIFICVLSGCEFDKLARNQHLDHHAEKFFEKAAMVQRTDRCIPISSHLEQGFTILYPYCSPEARRAETQTEMISANFQVAPDLAPRYHFWRRIYSVWGHDQYVIHLENHPEVILEIVDASTFKPNASPLRREGPIQSFIDKRKALYKDLLTKMQHYTTKASKKLERPAFRRLAELFAHIEEKNKFRISAQMVRSQRGQRDFIDSGVDAAQPYLFHIEKIFADYNLPRELALIAFVESSFNLKAYSKVGAAGIYQIMPKTGTHYGLIINDRIDERRDPIKSAEAAAKLLRFNYRVTKDWPLAITAYNHGVGSIYRAIKQVGVRDLGKIINEYNHKSFGFASQNFYTEFLGVVKSVLVHRRLGEKNWLDGYLRFRAIQLSKTERIKTLEKKYDFKPEQFLTLNPEVSRRLVKFNGKLPKGFTLKVPNNEEQTKKTELAQDERPHPQPGDES